MSLSRVARALVTERPFTTVRTAYWTLGTIGLEATARCLGFYDHLRRRPHHLWQMAMTTKAQIAGEIEAHSYQSVLVFHIARYHDFVLELGARGAQMLVNQVVLRIREALGTQASVNPDRSGTIIALTPVDQAEAEQIATRLIETIQATPVPINGHRDTVTVQVACGIIAFLHTGNAYATTVLAAT